MNKIKLIYHPNEFVNFTHGCVLPLVTEHFELVPYSNDVFYSPADCVVLTNHVSVLEKTPQWWQSFVNNGFKMVVDHLWDSDVDTSSMVKDGRLTLRNGNWLWYRESLYCTAVGYHEYRPNRHYRHSFFMPMNKEREHKDLTLKTLSPVLDQALWSYVAKGHLLPDDCDHNNLNNPVYWLYYMNPDWYDSTCFSVVVESYMRTNAWANNPRLPCYKTEVSEKIFKPMAYYHPFIVFGSYETLKYLHREGFETFGNLWDESYDNIVNDEQRHARATEVVVDAVRQYWPHQFAIDHVTEQKLQHNRNRFFNQPLVQQRFENEIIKDIKNFVNS